MLEAGVAAWTRTLTERSEGWAGPGSHPAFAVWPVVPTAPLNLRYRNPLMMTTRSSRQEPLKWGAAEREEKAVAEAEMLKATAYPNGRRERKFQQDIQLVPWRNRTCTWDRTKLRLNKPPRAQSPKVLRDRLPYTRNRDLPLHKLAFPLRATLSRPSGCQSQNS